MSEVLTLPEPFFIHDGEILYLGHALDLLTALPAATFQTVITSPPYWSLRNYGTDPQVWGGDPEKARLYCYDTHTLLGGGIVVRVQTGGQGAASAKQVTNRGSQTAQEPKLQGFCASCSAWIGELGSEPTPDLFIEHLRLIFRAVWRVLRLDGTLFLNLGDSYSGSGKGPTGWNGIGNQERRQGFSGTRDVARAHEHGNDDTAALGSQARDSSSRSRGDARRDSPQIHTPGTDPDHAFVQASEWCQKTQGCMEALSAHLPIVGSGHQLRTWQPSDATRDLLQAALRVSGQLLGALESTTLESGLQPQDAEMRDGAVWACRQSLRSFSDGAQTCVRRLGDDAETLAHTSGSASLFEEQALRTQYTLACCSRVSAWLNPPVVQPHSTISQDDDLEGKQLLMIPARAAIALQHDGWILRQDIIWHKDSVMPESVDDRPTTAHEHLFLFAKQGRYFYDGYAIREPYNAASLGRYKYALQGTAPTARTQGDGTDVSRREREKGVRDPNPAGRNARSVWTINAENNARELCTGCETVWSESALRRLKTIKVGDETLRICAKCKAHDKWLAHFAIFPKELARRCLKAGSSEHGACHHCGAPWERIIEKLPNPSKGKNTGADRYAGTPGMGGNHQTSPGLHRNAGQAQGDPGVSVGWRQTCRCQGSVPVPQWVLDPFSGSGTVLDVARAAGRRGTGLELQRYYALLAEDRFKQPMLPLWGTGGEDADEDADDAGPPL